MLLDGKYNDKMAEYRVIDCRFEYEYAGGHIPGAININTTAGVEEALLSNSFAPRPSMSADGSKKTILIFHCEFSAKRGPTL
jgi:M-phase inducer tyrosine phosphatase